MSRARLSKCARRTQVRRGPLAVRTVAVGLAGAVALAGAGCGAVERPGTLGDTLGPGGDSSSPALNLDASTEIPTCNLGPEGGVCACADEPLLEDVPTIYFVLDRSGSMFGAKWSSVQIALDKLVIALGPRAAIGAVAFPNPASKDPCAAGIEVFPPTRGDRPAGKAGATVGALVTVLNRIPAAGGTPTAATLASLLPRLTSLPGKTYVILATDGGPNCNDSAACTADMCTTNIDNNTPGCTPGGPTNCCSSAGTSDSCLDAQPTIDAVQQIASAGIPVYVVGVPGSAPYADLLDTLAVTGGTARGDEAQSKYYAIDSTDQSELLSALSGIVAQIVGTCTLELDSVPPDPGLVNVFLDEQALPQAGPDGWSLDGTTVTISGASCQSILQGNVLDVRVVAGCPTVAF